ncbi:MAG: protein kinase, partial [Pirellulaceae bacterium]
MQICSAVQHAHQKAVIHRDLKPTNVLVTEHDGKPVPKVIDFGLAKALNASQMLTERTLHTAYGTVVGTPLYMAPEQVGINALDVDTRTDIYALGVILYELLTGTTPLEKARFKEAAWEEVKRLIREDEPPRPSTRLSSDKTLASLAASRQVDPAQLPRLVRGELDWIVMKALDKDRARRYETANGLAKDVQRYLAGDAVEACPPTLGYRLRKVYRRNRTAVLTTASFAAVLLVATVVSLAFGILARQAESRAKTQEQVAQASAIKSAKNEAAAQDALKAEKTASEKLAKLDYSRSIQLAHQRWNEDSFRQALQLLEGTRPEFRDWEYHYLSRLFHGERLSVKGPDILQSANAKYTPDGSHFLTGGTLSGGRWGGTMILWDARTGAQRKTFTREGKLNKDPKLNRAGTRILAAYNNEKISDLVEWDIETGEAKTLLNGYQGSIFDASYSPDETRIVMTLGTQNLGESASVEVLDVKTGERYVLLEPSDESVFSVSYSPDGSKILITGSGRPANIRLVDVANRKLLPWTPEALSAGGCFAEFSPDGQRILGFVMNSTEPSVAVWDAQTGKRQITLPNKQNSLRIAAFSPDGKKIVTCGYYDGLITIWDAASAEVIRQFKGHESYVLSAVFSPDGRQILSADIEEIVKVWDLDAGTKPIPLPRHVARFNRAFAPDRSWIAANTPDGRDIAFYDTRTGAQIKRFHVDGENHDEFALSRDGTRMATASWSADTEGKSTSRTRIWDTATEKPIRDLSKVGGGWPYFAFSPDGQTLAVNSSEGIQLFRVKTGDLIRTLDGFQRGQRYVHFSPDGRLIVASGGEDTSVRLWEAENGKELPPFKGHHTKSEVGPFSQMGNAVFSPDGTRIASIGNGKTFIWDVSTREVLVTLNGLTDGNTVAFSLNGKRVITGNLRGITLWDAETGQELLSIKGRNLTPWGHAAMFSPDGALIPLLTNEG